MTLLSGLLRLVFIGWIAFCASLIGVKLVEWGKRVDQNAQICAQSFTEADDEP